MTSTGQRIILAGGHESADSADLARFAPLLPQATVTPPGRRLHDIATAGVLAGDTVIVVPMTLGRDPTMVADAAKTLRWLARTHGGSLALTAPFGVADHLTARLRAAANAVHARDPGAALVVAARASNPFDDAELHRIAHLVRVHGAGIEVIVATLPTDDAIVATLDRLRLLGVERSVVVPAGFAHGLALTDGLPGLDGMTEHGPLVPDSVVARIVADRVGAARHDLHHGRSGIEAGLTADHGHGYAHSHHHHDDAGHTHGPSPLPPARKDSPWSAESHRTTTVPTRSRSTPAARR